MFLISSSYNLRNIHLFTELKTFETTWSFFPQSYWTSEQRNISKTIDYFNMVYGTTNVSFWPYNCYQPGPARTDPDVDTRFKIVESNFEQKIFISFEIIAFLVKPIFCQFLHKFLPLPQEPLVVSKIWLFIMKERHKTYQTHNRFELKNNSYKV